MIKAKFYLNNKLIKEPLNYEELSISLNFDKDDPAQRNQVSVNNWLFGLGDNQDNQDAAKIVQTYINDGLTGGLGVFEGLPFRIELDNGATNDVLFNGFLDVSQGSFRCYDAELPAIESKGIDALNLNIDSFTYEQLWKDGIIGNDDTVLVPFQEYKPGDRFQAAMILITLFTITFQVWSFIQQVIGVISGSTSNPTEWGRIAEIVTLALSLVQLIVNIYLFYDLLFRYLFNPVKYKAGMYLYDLCKIGSNHLGYNFSSTILDGSDANYRTNGIGFDNVVLIPESYTQEQNSEDGVLGIFDIRNKSKLRGFYRGTFGDLLRELKVMFNAKVIIDPVTKVLSLERRDKLVNDSLYQIPNIDKRELPYLFNSDELKTYVNISFTPDDQDKVSLQEYTGTEVQIFTKPLTSTINTIQKGEQSNVIGWGLTVLKTELTPQEKFIKSAVRVYYYLLAPLIILLIVLFVVVNGLIAVVKGVLKVLKTLGIYKKPVRLNYINIREMVNPLKPFLDQYEDLRINILQFESDYLTTPKLVALKSGYQEQGGGIIKPSTNQRALLNANFLYEKFHHINNFIEDRALANTTHNQHKIYEIPEVNFCNEDYQKVKNDNFILDSDGKRGEVIDLEYNPIKGTARIKYKVKEKYTNNLKIEKNIPDGR